MAERVVNVKLEVQVANYLAGMEKASKATKAAAEEAKKLSEKAQAVELLGKTSLVMGAAVAAGLALAVAKFADFDQAMSEVQASTHESTANMELLRDAAIDAGARTVFSATEAANAIDELAKAGISTADILGGALDGALDLASAGGLGVADAAGIAATALTQFNLAGEDVPHVADLLAAGAGKAMG
ncbi:MAG: phage tail tape measure protein, partial [Mycetocola sp.]